MTTFAGTRRESLTMEHMTTLELDLAPKESSAASWESPQRASMYSDMVPMW